MTAQPSANHYFDFVTLSKGIAIVCVVLGHFTPAYMPPFYHGLKDSVYLFHMPLFMMLAGFLFANSLARAGGRLVLPAFVRKKFLRLMVPYFFLSFAIAALNGVLQQFMQVKVPVDAGYLCRIFYENTGGSATFLWFLYTLFLIFVFSAVTMYSRLTRRLVPWLALVLYFVPLPGMFYLNSAGSFLIYFVAGRYLYSHASSLLHFSWSRVAVCAVVFAASLFLVSRFPGEELLHRSASLLCGLSACYVIILFMNRLAGGMSRGVTLLRRLGDESMYIYLLHMAGVYPVRLVFERCGWHNWLSYALFLLLAIAVGCIVPVLVSKYVIRRLRFLRMLMGEEAR